MPSEQQLSGVLSEFARTMATDFPIQAILDHLVERIVDVVPITAAGVTVISPGADSEYVAASDASALRFEELQTELGEGPCLVAYRTGTPSRCRTSAGGLRRSVVTTARAITSLTPCRPTYLDTLIVQHVPGGTVRLPAPATAATEPKS